MTKIIVFKHNGNYTGFEARGHASYADCGKDIVCAAISILATNTINSIERFVTKDIAVTANENKGLIDFSIKSGISDKSNILIDSFILGLKTIENEYGQDYINIKIKEV